MESVYCQQRIEQTTVLIMQKFDRNDLYENIAISKYFGFIAKYLPDYSIKSVKAQAEILIQNAANKFKFWVKKDETGLPTAGVVLSVAELLKNASSQVDLLQ